jgi:hypothetical protein
MNERKGLVLDANPPPEIEQKCGPAHGRRLRLISVPAKPMGWTWFEKTEDPNYTSGVNPRFQPTILVSLVTSQGL